jgi:hypothetical protein
VAVESIDLDQAGIKISRLSQSNDQRDGCLEERLMNTLAPDSASGEMPDFGKSPRRISTQLECGAWRLARAARWQPRVRRDRTPHWGNAGKSSGTNVEMCWFNVSRLASRRRTPWPLAGSRYAALTRDLITELQEISCWILPGSRPLRIDLRAMARRCPAMRRELLHLPCVERLIHRCRSRRRRSPTEPMRESTSSRSYA